MFEHETTTIGCPKDPAAVTGRKESVDPSACDKVFPEDSKKQTVVANHGCKYTSSHSAGG